MLAVHMAKDKSGTLELNWMWLPTFISQNQMVMRELDKVWRENFKGVSFTEETEGATLRRIHDFTITWICERFKIPGLDKYLHGILHVSQP